MNKEWRAFAALASVACSFMACKPRPLEIRIPQAPPQITISAAVFDEHSVFVSAGYSLSSLESLKDTAATHTRIPQEAMLKDALLLLSENGAQPDTLYTVSPGLYGNRALHLHAGAAYRLEVLDREGKVLAVAATTYQAGARVERMVPGIAYNPEDTIVSLSVKLGQVQADDHYVVSYTTTRRARSEANPVSLDAAGLASFSPKQLSLYSYADARDGAIEKSFAVDAREDDTLIVIAGKIDPAYFDYLTVYKKSGSLINQLTGEPVNMPTNIVTGLGFFALYEQQRRVFYLRDYRKP